MGFFKPFPKPDQPIECWYMIIQNPDVGLLGDKIQFPWLGRTLILKTTASEMKMLHTRMPKGCSLDDPWIILLTSHDGSRTSREYTKSEFLKLFADVPLMPTDVFRKSYEAYLKDLTNYVDTISKIIHSFTL